jgi:outer membrane receptor protein involved in Fe transport
MQYASSYDLNTYREAGGSIVYSHSWTGLVEELQWGLDHREISGEDAQQSYRTPSAALPDALRLQRVNDGRGGQSFTGVFSQLKLHPFDPLVLTLGARVDRFGSSGGSAVQTNFSDLAAPVAVSTMGGPVPDLTKTAFDPSLSMRYEANEKLAFRGSVYKAFRAPGLNNLYRSFGSGSITIANPLLGPETLVGKEIGIDWKASGYSFGATLFEADVRNVVATYAITPGAPIPAAVQNICGASYTGTPNASCPGSVSFYTNGQDQRATGIELDGKWAVSRDLDLAAYATGTRTYYTRTTTGDPVGTQLPLVPKVVAGASLSWRAGSRWTHFFDVRYNSPMTLSSLTILPAVRQGGYAVFDASTQFRIDARFEVFGSIVNIFGKRYTDASANNLQSVVEAMPRTATIGLRAHF